MDLLIQGAGSTGSPGLIAGLLVGILSCYNNIQNFIVKPASLIGIVCFGISVFLSIISQFPVTQDNFYNKKVIHNPNLYFFGHLSNLDKQTFIDELKKVDNRFDPSKLDSDLIGQILINARITKAKFIFFKFSSCLTAFGCGLIGLSSIIKIIWHF